MYIADAMVRTIHHVTGAALESIPLVLALEWAEAHPEVFDRKTDGMELLRMLVSETQQVHEKYTE